MFVCPATGNETNREVCDYSVDADGDGYDGSVVDDTGDGYDDGVDDSGDGVDHPKFVVVFVPVDGDCIIPSHRPTSGPATTHASHNIEIFSN